MVLVGFCGNSGSGKNTLSSLLMREILALDWDCYIEEYALANAVKQVASIAFNLPIGAFHNIALKEQIDPYWNLSPRAMAQLVGTESFRDVFGTDFWIKVLAKELEGTLLDIALITDVRFANEVEWVHSKGGIVIRVTREGYTGNVGVANHTSEQLPSLDMMLKTGSVIDVQNDSSLKDLAAVAKTIAPTVLKLVSKVNLSK